MEKSKSKSWPTSLSSRRMSLNSTGMLLAGHMHNHQPFRDFPRDDEHKPKSISRSIEFESRLERTEIVRINKLKKSRKLR